VLERYRVRISDRRPVIPIEVFVISFSPSRKIPTIVFLNRPQPLLFTCFQIHQSPLLIVLHCLAWAKNTLWARPCLCVSFLLGTRQPATQGHSCNTLFQQYKPRYMLGHIVAATSTEVIVETNCCSSVNRIHCSLTLQHWPRIILLQQWPSISLLPLMPLLHLLFAWLPWWRQFRSTSKSTPFKSYSPIWHVTHAFEKASLNKLRNRKLRVFMPLCVVESLTLSLSICNSIFYTVTKRFLTQRKVGVHEFINFKTHF
jgi:hypothetical protein